MEIQYQNNLQLGPGYGFFIIDSDSLVAGVYTIILQRSVDRCYLGQNGTWQDTDSSFTLNAKKDPVTKKLRVDLPPTIVNALDSSNNYRLILENQENQTLKIQGRFRADNIIYSQESLLNNAVEFQSKPSTQPPQPTAPASQPEEPTPNIDSLDIQEPLEQPNEQAKKKIWIMACCCLFVALCLLGYVAYDFFFDESADKHTAQTQSNTEHQNPNPFVGNQKTSSPTSQVQRANLSIEDQVRNFFRQSDRSAMQAVNLAANLKPQTKAEQDALFRLYYFAIEQGEKSILIPYAACLDPSKPQWVTKLLQII